MNLTRVVTATNYVDDWIGYSNCLAQLCEDFEQFLRVCEKYNITLGPHKTRFGFKEAQFFEFRVNAEGSHLALKHLDPIRQMVPPSDVHELRRVLGIFVVSRKYVKDFANITKPMTVFCAASCRCSSGEKHSRERTIPSGTSCVACRSASRRARFRSSFSSCYGC